MAQVVSFSAAITSHVLCRRQFQAFHFKMQETSNYDHFLEQLKSKQEGPLRVVEAVSDMDVKNHVRYKWQLKRYSTLPDEEYTSTSFSAPGSNIKWSLKFQPRFYDNRDRTCHALLTLKSGSNCPRVRVFYKVHIVDVDGNECHAREGFFYAHILSGFVFDFSRQEISVEKKTLSLEGTLTFVCDVFETTEYTASPAHLQVGYSCSEKKSHAILEELIAKCKKNAENNVTLIGKGDVRFEANKFILGARSAVFETMFDTPMEEQRTNVVELNDVDGDVLQEVINFVNTDAVGDLKKFAEPLLVVADRYQLLKLKMLCEEHLMKLISPSSLPHLQSLAEMANAPMLKKSCRLFSNSNQRREDSNTEPSRKKIRS